VFTGLEEFRNWADAKSEMMARIADSNEEVATYKLALIDERAVCDEWQIRAQKAEKILEVFNVKHFVSKKS
jgi:precorrin-6x reductase